MSVDRKAPVTASVKRLGRAGAQPPAAALLLRCIICFRRWLRVPLCHRRHWILLIITFMLSHSHQSPPLLHPYRPRTACRGSCFNSQVRPHPRSSSRPARARDHLQQLQLINYCNFGRVKCCCGSIHSFMSSSQVAKSYSARHTSTYHPGSNVGNMSRRRSDVDTGDFFKVIEIPFSPFQNDFGAGDDEDFNFAVSSRGDPRGSRQEFLRSYTFSRATKQTVYEKMKSNLLRLRATAWAVVACNYPRIHHNPSSCTTKSRVSKVCRSSLPFRPSHLICGSNSHHQSTSRSTQSNRRPLLLPHCFGLN